MNKIYLSLLLLFMLIINSCSDNETLIKLKTKSLEMGISKTGNLSYLIDLKTGENFLAKDTITSLISVRIHNKIISPKFTQVRNNILIVNFNDDTKANIKIEQKDTHLTFELLSLSSKDSIELIIWGPFYTNLSKVIGETVGIVQGDKYAIGIQSLNIKTLGGYPWNESDRMPAFNIFAESDPSNMHPANDGSVLYRVEAAKPTKSGSSLQAYCRNRNKDRIIQDFNHTKIIAPAYNDGGLIGSKIAIFGCSVKDVLQNIAAIEIAEGLAHPVINGQWAKTAPEATSTYLITDFTEKTIDKAIELTKKAGLNHLYHYGKTFESWGHFKLYKGEFPNGIKGLKRCVEKAKAQGIYLGTHFLSNFITTNDPYVTPVPDKRLAAVGYSVITADISENDTDIPIQSPDFFNQMKNNNLKTVRIGNELIRYGTVSDNAPWKLLDCQRGAFNTSPSAHKSGTQIVKLLDHGYKVFLSNAELTIEISKRIASLYNKTGLRQISFDGLEGNRSTGLGTYGESLMPYIWYNTLSDSLKNNLIIDASRTTHFFWHIFTRMNWGEPWYGGFRESQTSYRFNNQAYFKRNFIPGMLGWFKMTPETSIEDTEWLLAKSAGYDAGYALVASFETINKNGNSDKILELVGDWEKLRLSNSFSEEQKSLMRKTDNEFSLIRTGTNKWNLNQINVWIFKHDMKEKQPGEPLYSSFEINNTGEKQLLNFIFTAHDCDANNITIEIDNYKEIKLSCNLKKGQILKYQGGSIISVYNPSWQKINEIKVNASDFLISKNKHTVLFDCNFTKKGASPYVKVELKTIAKKEKVSLNTTKSMADNNLY